MAADLRNPFGDMKGYQFWALLGALTIVVPRILLFAADVPLGILTVPLWTGPEADILACDAIGALIVANARLTYKSFLDRSTA